VERSHRTLQELTLGNQRFESAEALQKHVDADWQELNAAGPRLWWAAHPEWERELFDLKRVDAYLAEFTWLRTCTSVGQLHMRKVRYSLGAAWVHQEVAVTYDPEQRQFVFTQARSETRKGQEQPQLHSSHFLGWDPSPVSTCQSPVQKDSQDRSPACDASFSVIQFH